MPTLDGYHLQGDALPVSSKNSSIVLSGQKLWCGTVCDRTGDFVVIGPLSNFFAVK